MKIALDGSDLISKKLDGTTIYARELLPRLAQVLLERGMDVEIHASADPQVKFPTEANVIVTHGNRFWTQTVLSRVLFRAQPDCLFVPVQTMPLYRPEHLRVVAVVHDLDFWEYPSMFTLKNRLLLHWFTRAVARHATRIIAVSDTTKREIVKRYGRNPNDITVVHHGINREMFRLPSSDEEYEKETARVRKTYGISQKPVLFVGAMQPRKNIQGLLDAFEKLRARGSRKELVLVSGNGWKKEEILSRIRRSSAKHAVHVLERVPDDDMRALYWNASVFVLPSFAEGFGMPVLEAMACGVPTVISDAEALQEIAGGAARVVHGDNTSMLARAIEEIVDDGVLRASLRTKGLERVSCFSWDDAAVQTASVILNIVVQ